MQNPPNPAPPGHTGYASPASGRFYYALATWDERGFLFQNSCHPGFTEPPPPFKLPTCRRRPRDGLTEPTALRTLHKLTPWPLTSTEASSLHTARNSIKAKREEQLGSEERRAISSGGMDRNLSGFLIGCVGAAVTLLAYQQTVVTSTQCVAAGFVVLLFALFALLSLYSCLLQFP
ncbi:hypothetical protein HU200_027510 [Digitaria exilis]|uniref:Uncharacterized protein n=1 Tax=Digitaria exilis TaxID=1010633 RepID=A0A835BX88_9POAL|nr:hypothetical protein HU200_027510 [Digitaria exilis]